MVIFTRTLITITIIIIIIHFPISLINIFDLFSLLHTPPSKSPISSNYSSDVIEMHPDPSTYSSQIIMNPQFPEHEHLNCPRCDSSNTKFCYYNNYNLSQPRHFCKNCRRYWTKGGTLRNIPVGGATRKITKRSSKRTATSPPKPEPPGISGSNQTEVGGSFRGSFLTDGLSRNLAGGSQKVGLIRSPASDAFQINHLSANDQNNQSRNGWPNLSIDPPGT